MHDQILLSAERENWFTYILSLYISIEKCQVLRIASEDDQQAGNNIRKELAVLRPDVSGLALDNISKISRLSCGLEGQME
ncbi:MAG: hypothetical protein A3J97_08470 [Spirochaetes bacterium RIFOXYC1_FULL_54_7]|nr:MAG: hypothetical protein A3J97_08470 [Spirochaetes bacterium RIFOXYC1_FULL_54_7]